MTMKIAVTSQNFRTITGHAGKTRRFLVFEVEDGKPELIEKLDLPRDMSFHELPHGNPHPVDGVDILITASCGDGFRRKMTERGIALVVTEETDPDVAASHAAAERKTVAAIASGN